jgi:hypothetical protein
MAHVAGSIQIEVEVERVFDTVADARNEPSFNEAMGSSELLTAEPIGLGSRFRARMGESDPDMIITITEFDRPHRLGSITTSSIMETSGTLTFVRAGDATVMSWDWQVRPKGWFQVFTPLVGPMGRRMERKIWTGLKRKLENAQPR